jgi:hypothetical protein
MNYFLCILLNAHYIYQKAIQIKVTDLNELYTKELHNLYAPRNIIKRDEMDRACSMHGRDEKFIQNFGQKT